MLVWDDKSSINTELLGGNGMMATHDEDTRRYFKNTGVSSLVGGEGGGGFNVLHLVGIAMLVPCMSCLGWLLLPYTSL